MAKQNKVSGKVKDQGNGKYKIDKGNGPDEVDIDIDLHGAGTYEVDKLETDTLPKSIDGPDGKPISIRWFNNFSIQENKKYIKKKYNVTIPGLQVKLKEKDSKLVIYSDTHDPKLYYYGPVDSDTFVLEDGDPGGGMAP